MFKNVVTALAEARDITLYLSPLMKHFLQVCKLENIYSDFFLII